MKLCLPQFVVLKVEQSLLFASCITLRCIVLNHFFYTIYNYYI